jgi:hypothetical protein
MLLGSHPQKEVQSETIHLDGRRKRVHLLHDLKPPDDLD